MIWYGELIGMIWYGQLVGVRRFENLENVLNIRLANSDIASNTGNGEKKTKIWIISVVVAGSICLGIFALATMEGKLAGGEKIALKRLSRRSCQGLEDFKNEMMLTAKRQHRNQIQSSKHN